MIRRPSRHPWLAISRRKAFLSHLAVSASVVTIVCALIFFVWYPGSYFEANGAWAVLRVLVGVDLVLGPVLTLLVFKPGKPGLAFDLLVIASVQITALVYGVTVTYQERPYFTVFAGDRFNVVALPDIEDTDELDLSFGSKPLIGPLLVAAIVPTDLASYQKLLDEIIIERKPDIDKRPQYWKPYDEVTATVAQRAGPISELLAFQPHIEDDINALVERHGTPLASLGFLPLVGKHKDMSVVINVQTGMPVDIVNADPWLGAD